MSVLLALGVVAFVGAPLPAAADSRSVELADQPGVVVDRSEFATTTATGDGKRHTRVSPEAVNFEESKGKWQEIDRTLEPVGGGDVSPAAVDGDAVIPPSLSQALELTHDGRSLSFRLRGAQGGRALAGSKARFDDVLPGVDAVYSARSAGLKETLVLRDRGAQRSFTYDLVADDDLEAAVLPGGELVLRDQSGDVQFQVSAPLAWDSAAPVAYSDALKLSVEPNGPGRWTLVMRPDEAWLASPDRVFPVSLDPDFFWANGTTRFHGANTDCYLSSGNQATTNFCAATTFKIGSSTANTFRANFRFDVAQAVPATASVSAAQLVAFQPGTASHAASDTRLRAITSAWDSNAT